MTELRGARVLVVGASGGLGSVIARELDRAGATLALAGRTPERLAAVRIDAATQLTGELDDPATPARLVSEAVDALGGLDGVVYAAGVVAFGAVADLDDDDLDELLLVNYLAPVRLTRAALPVLGRGGFIANLSAVVAERPLAGMAAYSASKAALTGFDTAVRQEARRSGIRVVDIRPPHTETGLATRPIAGQAPRLPAGLSPEAVGRRIVAALAGDETELPASAFGDD